MKLKIEFIMSTGGTLMATSWHGGEYFVEHGQTFEEAEKKLIEALKKKQYIVIPPPKEIEIDL